ncbi:hypothetical protein BT93_J1754 [Corymbia citriodora subsp. variegata]|nr:hypothetical protein BT93_J1754 [Corymbia citriodora subsp. variegata]
MQDSRMLFTEEVSDVKPRKKKAPSRKATLLPLHGNGVHGVQQLKGTPSAKNGQKNSKRNLKNDVSTLLHQQERSNSDSLPDSSASGDEYRALRRRYLLLEEESFTLGNELREVEKEVKVLEEEKFALLDKLVVLEGLIDPSELHM